MASEFVSYVGRLITVRSVVQRYPGPFVRTFAVAELFPVLRDPVLDGLRAVPYFAKMYGRQRQGSRPGRARRLAAVRPRRLLAAGGKLSVHVRVGSHSPRPPWCFTSPVSRCRPARASSTVRQELEIGMSPRLRYAAVPVLRFVGVAELLS